jgi:hypothetical protein
MQLLKFSIPPIFLEKRQIRINGTSPGIAPQKAIKITPQFPSKQYISD